MEDIQGYKRECLMDEHRTLSSFIEKEMVVTSLTRNWCIGAWLAGLAAVLIGPIPRFTGAIMLLVAINAFWVVDLVYSYVGVIYKMRRLKIRAWLDELPEASDETVAGWKTPANPFDGLGRSEKIGALTDAVKSPMVLAVYFILEVATVAILAFG